MVELVKTQSVRLEDVACVNPRLSEKIEPSTSVSFVGMTDLSIDGAVTEGEEVRPYKDVANGYKAFLNGDLLVAKITPCFENGKIGQARLSTKIGFGSTEFHVVRPNPELADSRFLLHFLRSPRFRASGEMRMTGSGGQRRVPVDYVKKTELYLPPLEEQQRIAAVLDKTDELRAKRREALARLDDLVPAIFHDMFGDPTINPLGLACKPLTEVGHLYSGGTPSKADPRNWVGNLPWFSPKDMKRDDLFDSADHIDEEVPARSSLKRLPKNTVAFVVRGMILAHTFPVSVLRVESTVNQDMKAVIPRESIDPDFLAACLRVQASRILTLVDTAAHGTKKLNARALANIQILIPSLEAQAEFANCVTSVRRLRADYEAQVAELDGLFAVLQHRAFSGQL